LNEVEEWYVIGLFGYHDSLLESGIEMIKGMGKAPPVDG
jgi:hypothetical protein